MKFKLIESGKPTTKQLSFGIRSLDEERGFNQIWLYLFNRYWYWNIDKQIVKSQKKWVDTSHYEWATKDENGKSGYTDHIQVEYSISIRNDSISLHYGPNLDCWPNKYSKYINFPWKDARTTSITFFEYNPKTKELKTFKRLDESNCVTVYDTIETEKEVPKFKIAFNDYDGTEVVATCYVQERRWKYGVRWTKFLGLFQKENVRRAVHFKFDKETGTEKGSWKGGTLGTGCDLEIGQDPFEAFKIYAASTHRDKRPFTNVRLLEE